MAIGKKQQYNAFGPYKLSKTIGEGEFGKVRLAYHMDNGKEVAIKLIKKESIQAPNRRNKLMREISILQSLNHKYIVKLLEVIETDNYIGMIMEYASGGELFEHILARRFLKENEAARMFAQLVSDLKLENLLLDGSRNVIITDFGFANVFSQNPDELLQTSCGSPCYAAPELVISDGYVGESADIWSLGVILYAMLCGYLPFDDDPANPEGDNLNLLYKYIMETPLEFPSYVSESARSLIQRILVPDPKKRADMIEILNHPWLRPFAFIFGSESKGVLERLQKTAGPKSSAGRASMELERISLADLPKPTGIILGQPVIEHSNDEVHIYGEESPSSPLVDSPHPLPLNSAANNSPYLGAPTTSESHLPLGQAPLQNASPHPSTIETGNLEVVKLSALSAIEESSKEEVEATSGNPVSEKNLAFLSTDPNQVPVHSARGKSMDVRRAFKQNPPVEEEIRASTSVVPGDLQGKEKLSVTRKAAVNKELMKLRFHSGPIDQRALSSRPPDVLVKDTIKVLNEMGLIVQPTKDEYKLKVTRPAGSREPNIEQGDLGRRESRAFSQTSEKKRSLAKFAYMLAHFPVSLVKRLKYLAQFGTQYNYGFDGHSKPELFKKQPLPVEYREIKFHLMIHRIKNLDGLLIVDVKRLRGDIWQFKALYHEIIPRIAEHEK